MNQKFLYLQCDTKVVEMIEEVPFLRKTNLKSS